MRPRYASAARAALLSALLLIALPVHAQHPSVRVQVIDRGQADGILIRTPNEKWVVIDAGKDSLQADSMRNVWGVDEVALAIVSHRHADHFGGMERILRNFDVGLLVMNMADCPNRSTDNRIRTAAQERGIATQSVGADTITVDGVKFIILEPDPVEDPCPDHENDNSIVVRMEYGDFSMLFAGDAETAEREWLMRHHPELLDVDVLKVSHHGSRNGVDGEVDGRSWLEFVTPDDVVISVGNGNTYGHPHAEAMDRYEALGAENVHCTIRDGTVRVYGYESGSHRIHRQFESDESCRT